MSWATSCRGTRSTDFQHCWQCRSHQLLIMIMDNKDYESKFMTTMIINGTSYDKRLDYNDHNQVIEWQGRSLQSRSYEEVLAHDNN